MGSVKFIKDSVFDEKFSVLLSHKKEIYSRTVLLQVTDGEATFTSSDRVSYLTVQVLVESAGEFEAFIDLPAFQEALKFNKREKGIPESEFFYDKGHFYTQVMGGNIFIPTYNFPKEHFSPKLRDVVGQRTLEKRDTWLRAISASKNALPTSILDLQFSFFSEDGLYFTDSSAVMKIQGEFIQAVIRSKDMLVAEKILALPGDIQYFSVYEDLYSLAGGGAVFHFPKVQIKMSPKYLLAPDRPGSYFKLNSHDLRGLLKLLGEKFYRRSGELLFRSDGLSLRVTSVAGEVSSFSLSSSLVGEFLGETVTVPLDSFSAVMGVLESYGEISRIGVRKDRVLLCNDAGETTVLSAIFTGGVRV